MFQRNSHFIVAFAAAVLFSASMLVNPASCKGDETFPQASSGKGGSTENDRDELMNRVEELEMKLLHVEAELMEESTSGEISLNKTFRSGQRSLQALNPEISITGDMFAKGVYSDTKEYNETGRTGFYFRHLGLHFQASLDPFSFMKVAVGVDQHEAHLGEAYTTWTSVLPGVQLTAGKFRQQLGIVNRWHKHGLDQFDFPLMLQRPFGPGGLNQVGMSMRAQLPPLWADNLDMTLEITNAMNGGVFAGDYFSLPAGLVRIGNYWDLSRDTYLELGLTGMAGPNNGRGIPAPDTTGATIDEPGRLTLIAGFDLTLNNEPVNRAKYRRFTLRSEVLYIKKHLPDDSEIDWIGGYTSLEYRLNRSAVLGVRGDLVQEFAEGNTLESFDSLESLLVPYITWWQSPWVRLRLEYNFHQPISGDPDHGLIFQVTYAAGPHKHERY